MRNGKGFTLIEMLIAISIMGCLFLISTPKLDRFLTSTHVDNQISTLQRLLLLTRNASINYQLPVTFCPLDMHNHCSNTWGNELSVFTDINNNKQLNIGLGERVLSVKKPIAAEYTLQYGTTRIGVTYAPTGRLSGWGQNATFKVCPKSDLSLTRGITVAVSGRLYPSFKNNNQGPDRNRSGVPITCA